MRKICLRLGTSCPNRDGTLGRGGCIFCADGEARPAPPVEQQLRAGLERLPVGTRVIAYLQDHTATHLPAARLDEVLEQLSGQEQVVALHVGTRPDSLPNEILEVLRRHGARRELLVELGLQSACEATLAFNRRQHTVQHFCRAVQQLHRCGLQVCAHVVLGLPTPRDGGALVAEPAAGARRTARLLNSLGVEAVKIHNCHVLRHTELARIHSQGRFDPPRLEGYMERLFAFLALLDPQTEIHRLMGEARPPLLLAPEFTGHKNRSLQQIRRQMEQRDVRQGSALEYLER